MELTSKRIQDIWDYELISAWDETGKTRIWSVVDNFMSRVRPELKKFELSCQETEGYLVSLNLKRCLDINHELKTKVFRSFRTDVIGFIHGRSEGISNALMSGELKPIILLSINNYKWTKKNTNAAAKFRRTQRQQEKYDSANLKVKARSLSKKHDWEITK